jgi:hypothetical protein
LILHYNDSWQHLFSTDGFIYCFYNGCFIQAVLGHELSWCAGFPKGIVGGNKFLWCGVMKCQYSGNALPKATEVIVLLS